MRTLQCKVCCGNSHESTYILPNRSSTGNTGPGDIMKFQLGYRNVKIYYSVFGFTKTCSFTQLSQLSHLIIAKYSIFKNTRSELVLIQSLLGVNV